MLGVASALVGHQIRTDIERELRRVGASARELGVHVELFTLLCEMLLLRHDAVHVVIAHLQPVGSGLAVRSGIGSRGTCQTVECVIRIGMCHLSARLSAFGKCGLVGNAEHVAYGIVGIGIVNNGLLGGQKTK